MMRLNPRATQQALAVALAMLAISAGAGAQRPPLAGTVNPRAVAPPVAQPAPIGGLRTVPIGALVPDRRPDRRHGSGDLGAYPSVFFPGSYVPLRVIDAPFVRGGAVVFYDNSNANGVRWFPSSQQPEWRIDSLAPRVEAWRDIVVDDVICTSTGACLERTTRMRARWSPYCNCYRFADALGRIWRVE